jgi:hypothetical protein
MAASQRPGKAGSAAASAPTVRVHSLRKMYGVMGN